jgi:hypothetical protein
MKTCTFVAFEGYVEISKFHLQSLFRKTKKKILTTFPSSSKSADFSLGLFLSPPGVSLTLDNGWKRFEDFMFVGLRILHIVAYLLWIHNVIFKIIGIHLFFFQLLGCIRYWLLISRLLCVL